MVCAQVFFALFCFFVLFFATKPFFAGQLAKVVSNNVRMVVKAIKRMSELGKEVQRKRNFCLALIYNKKNPQRIFLILHLVAVL